MLRSSEFFLRQTVRSVCLFCALVSLGGGFASPLQAQQKGNRLTPRFVASAPPDAAKGREIMESFRSLGLPGDYFLEFDLEVLPRRGQSVTLTGRMWGSRNDVGPIFRASLRDATGADRDHLLAQNGPTPASWRYVPGDGAVVEQLTENTLLDPIAGTGLSMFELQMPFIYWSDYVFEGVTRTRGRPVHAFLMYPPDAFRAAHPDVAGVRVYLDIQFHALMEAEILNGDEVAIRRLTVLDLKKLGDQWIVKSIDVRDEVTRDKVRFEVTGAALDADFSRQLFAPAEMVYDPRTPIGVERFGR